MQQRLIRSKALVAIFLLPACLATPGGIPTCRPATTTYSGDAFGASVNVLFLHTTLSDTGPLPSSGGSVSNQLASVNIPPLVKLGLLTESATGGSNMASAQSSVADVSVNAAGINITASVLTANAAAQSCGSVNPSVSGASIIAGLRVNGLPVTVTGAPNQTIPLIVGSLIINEQIGSVTSTSCGGSANMLVNALHLKVAGIADLVISSAQAGVSCVSPQQ